MDFYNTGFWGSLVCTNVWGVSGRSLTVTLFWFALAVVFFLLMVWRGKP